jgi:hypothetical protein
MDLILLLKHRMSQEGKYLNNLLRSLEHFGKDLLAHYDRSCWFCHGKHFDYQCRSHVEHVVASFYTHNYVPLGIKEVERYVIFKGAYELKLFIDEIYETSGVAHKHDREVTRILIYCMDTFEDNVYVVELNKKGTTNQLSTSLLHKEEEEEAMVPSKSEIESLDDGRILLNNPPCLEIDTMLYVRIKMMNLLVVIMLMILNIKKELLLPWKVLIFCMKKMMEI